jgi:hypothetical protein
MEYEKDQFFLKKEHGYKGEIFSRELPLLIFLRVRVFKIK